MGAKQSKRSVDISGKDGDAAGEVAAGGGGEGRVEQLADADVLKPQLNGDAHIHEPTDKEKELDSGTPENEKDATTEKENKEQDEEKEKDASPIANGDGEPKTENGDSAPTPEDAKKPKKEKVKKKWSLRSISFSRKDKPKQEKKQKEEEPKTNGEPEKVPEETAESSPEPVVNEETEEAKIAVDAKDEKAPDTPVTEPITNGSSTPESPKLEIPPAEETVAVTPEEDKPEMKTEIEPELPVNGLSLEETKQDIPEIENKIEEIIASKPDETPVETTEVVPVPEIPVKKEVCVEQVPLIEPTPPPLPANPPPSSVASFAATTMAPELTDASLSNTTETSVLSQPSATESNTSYNDNISEPQTNLTNATSVTDVLTSHSIETKEGKTSDHLECETEPKRILETAFGTLETNVENEEESKQEPAPEMNSIEVSIDKVDNKIEECCVAPDIDELKSLAASECNVDKLDDEPVAIKADEREKEKFESEDEVTINNESVSTKKIGCNEEIHKMKENEMNDNVEPNTLHVNVVINEAEFIGSLEESHAVVDKNNEALKEQGEKDVAPETDKNIETTVTETVDVVEFPPPPPDVHDAVDKRDEVMDETNDTDGQEPLASSKEVDCNNTETNIVADAKDFDNENIEVTSKAVEEADISSSKDPLGNNIEQQERNGNVDSVDTSQEIISSPNEDESLLVAGDVETSKTEAGNDEVTTDESLGGAVSQSEEATAAPELAETAEAAEAPGLSGCAPGAGDAASRPAERPAQDPVPEIVTDKMAELITEVSPVPELKTEMETSSDVAVAN